MDKEIKSKLLNTGLFNDDIWMDKYVNIVTYYDEGDYLKKHHIIPKGCYKIMQILDKSIINDKSNIVKLSYNNHILAHYYLYKASKNDEARHLNLIALFNMLNEKHIDDVESLLQCSLENYEKMRKEFRTRVSEINKGKIVGEETKNKIRINHADCSGESNSRAVNVYVFDLNTKELIDTLGAISVASSSYDISNLRSYFKRNNGVYIRDNLVFYLYDYYNNVEIDKFICKIKKLEAQKRYEYNFICKYCGTSYKKLLRKDQYEEMILKNNFMCDCCNHSGVWAKGTKHTEEHKTKLSNSSKGRKWINNGKEAKQLKEPLLSEYLKQGWMLGQLKKEIKDEKR